MASRRRGAEPRLFPGSAPGPGAKRLLLVLCLTLAVVAAGIPALGDEVHMTNGDVIRGTIVTLGDGKLKVKPPYSAEVELEWTSVKGLRSEGPVELVLDDGTRVKGPVLLDPDGSLRIHLGSTGDLVIRDLAQIQGINPPVPKPITYKGNVQVGVSLSSGNAETVGASADADFVARAKRQRLTIRGSWHYAEDNNEVSARDASGSIKYDFFPLEHLYVYANTLLDYNAFQDLNLRSTIGGGLGYEILHSDKATLDAELGVSYFNEDKRIGTDQGYASGRWSVNMEYAFIPDKISLFHFHEGYFSLEDFQDLFIKSKQGVRFSLFKDFFTSLQANLDFDNTPTAGLEKVDTKVLFSLGYSFNL